MKDMQNLHTVNYQRLLKNYRKHRARCIWCLSAKDSIYLFSPDKISVKISVLSKLIYRFSRISNKFSKVFFKKFKLILFFFPENTNDQEETKQL